MNFEKVMGGILAAVIALTGYIYTQQVEITTNTNGRVANKEGIEKNSKRIEDHSQDYIDLIRK